MSEQALSPWSILTNAVKAVPVLRYAIGLTGLAAAIAIVRGLLPDVRFVAMAPILIGAIGCMALLLIVAQAARRPEVAVIGTVFLWAVCLFVIAVMAATLTAIIFGQPKAWAETILPTRAEAAPAPPAAAATALPPKAAAPGPSTAPPATNATAPATDATAPAANATAPAGPSFSQAAIAAARDGVTPAIRDRGPRTITPLSELLAARLGDAREPARELVR